MRFLICGLGSIGRRHLRNLTQLGQADIVLLRSGMSTLPDVEQFDFPIETDLATALAKWRPDAAIVSNPTALHLEVAIPAAEAGCHLLIEKPISHSMERIDELVRAVEASGSSVLVGYQFRFHPLLARLRELIEGGALGRVLAVRSHWGEYLPDWHPWEDYRESYSARADLGGGVVLTLSHTLDYITWLLGRVQSVSAELAMSGELEVDVEDIAEIMMKLEQGSLASVHLDYNQRPSRHTLEVIGADGTAIFDALQGSLMYWEPESKVWRTENQPEAFDRNQLFLWEMSHFIELIQGGVDSRCTLSESIEVLRIALAASESSRTGKRVFL